MSNTDNTNTTTESPNAIHDVDFAHRVADIEDSVRTDIKNGDINFLGRTLHKYVYAQDNLTEMKRRSYDEVQAHDHRIEHIWQKLWDALSGDIEQDETWGMFMNEIPGMPDLRTKTYGGVVTLKFYFAGVEVSGDDNDDIESAILEQIAGDLQYGYEDETAEVDYEEE